METLAKQRLHVILIVDVSSSMRGKRIAQVNGALEDIRKYLVDLQYENVNVDFYMSTLAFGTEAGWIFKNKNVEKLKLQPIQAGGYSNLHLAYRELCGVLKKQSRGGIMPDFGGVAPILLLLSDGHPTQGPLCMELRKLKELPWFRSALKYGVAIGLSDDRTKKVLSDFVGENGDVVECLDADMLKRIIKVIVLTASKVKSQSTGIGQNGRNVAVGATTVEQEIAQQVGLALQEVDDWEW